MRCLRHQLWSWLCRHPTICNANAYGLVIEGERRSPFVGAICRLDCATTGCCWCGKVNG